MILILSVMGPVCQYSSAVAPKLNSRPLSYSTWISFRQYLPYSMSHAGSNPKISNIIPWVADFRGRWAKETQGKMSSCSAFFLHFVLILFKLLAWMKLLASPGSRGQNKSFQVHPIIMVFYAKIKMWEASFIQNQLLLSPTLCLFQLNLCLASGVQQKPMKFVSANAMLWGPLNNGSILGITRKRQRGVERRWFWFQVC